MISTGTLLYIQPYFFDNGSAPKAKYFVVLSVCNDDTIVASLPTSQDHIPGHITKKHGCIESSKDKVNCYYFSTGKVICDGTNFVFPKETYIYGEQIALVSTHKIKELHSNNSEVTILGKINTSEFDAMIDCFKNASTVRRKIQRLL